MGTLRSASGDVDDDNPVVSMLYSLLRDFVHPGDLEKIVSDIEGAMSNGRVATKYTNGWLAKYAQNIAKRLHAAPWEELTNEQRLELIRSACVGCGTLEKPCHCTNDE